MPPFPEDEFGFCPLSILFFSNCFDNDGDEAFPSFANIILLLVIFTPTPTPTPIAPTPAANDPNPNNFPSSPCICFPES